MATLVGFQNIQEKTSKFQVNDEEPPISTPGPFRATQMWNGIVDHLRASVEVRTRKHMMRSYEDCFTGADAVDVTCAHLERESADVKEVTREKIAKLCQYFLDHNIMEDAQACGNTVAKRAIFMDSNSHYYRFSSKDMTVTPSSSSSRDFATGTEAECSDKSVSPQASKRRLSMDILQQPFDRKRKKRSSFGMGKTARLDYRAASMAEGRSASLKGIRNPAFEDPYSDTLSAILSPARRPLTAHNGQERALQPGLQNIGRESRRERRLSKEDVSEIWKEVIIQRILHLVELPHLDNLLACTENYRYESADRIERAKPNLGTPRGRASSRRTVHRPDINDIDPWLRSAIHCLEAHPEGAALKGELCCSSRPLTAGALHARKLLLYRAIVRLYAPVGGNGAPLLPLLIMDIVTTILGALGGGKGSRAVELTQLVVQLLPAATRLRLRALLRFMGEASKKTAVKLVYQVDNRTNVCNTFHAAIIASPLLSAVQAKNLVSFFLDTQNRIFKVPEAVLKVATARLARARQGERDLSRVLYCERITPEEFDVCDHAYTDEAVTKLMNSIIDNTKVSLKEKRHKLKLLQKCHPDIFNSHFSGML